MATQGDIVNKLHLKLEDDNSHSNTDSEGYIVKGNGVTLMGFVDDNEIIDIHDDDDDDMDVIKNDKDTLKPHDGEDQDNDDDWVLNPGVTLMGQIHDTPHTNVMNNDDEKRETESETICSDTDDDDPKMDFKHNFVMGFAHENEKISYNQSENAQSIEWIVKCLQHNPLFVSNLNNAQIKHIAQTMDKRYVRVNDIMIEQDSICDTEDGKFYIIESGSYAAFIDGIKVRSWDNKGDIFGELSLFNDTPRAATVKCTRHGFAWYLDRKRFQFICDKYGGDDAEIEWSKSKDKATVLWLLGCIETNDLFCNLNFVTKTEIVKQMKLIEPQYNEKIILQDSIRPLTVYVVEGGEYFAIIDGMRVTSWVRGGIFGELALLYDKPRSATIQCASQGNENRLWMLDRKEFERICDEYSDCDVDDDALYREYICHKNVKRKRQDTMESNVDSVVSIQSNDNDEYYMQLFVENAIGNVIEGDVICNGDAMDCNCFKRIGYVLSIYKDNDDESDKEGVNYYQILNETLGSHYNTSVLCDDLYHVIATHCSASDFCILYDVMIHIFLANKTCDADSCVMMRRNNRIRGAGDKNRELYGVRIMNDAQQITTKQLLDKLHCFFIHSFDCDGGHRIVPRTRARANDDKFVVNLHAQQQQSDDMMYSFGYKFVYWDDLNDGLVIHKKYASLKAELLLNDLSRIDRSSWRQLLMTSDAYHKANHVQKMYCADVNNRGIKRKDIIRQSHLICILMYCNFDAFQRTLTETYRKQSEDEDMARLSARHCNFYWCGRLLYEAVNVYGKRVIDYEYKTFYHGISQQMYFTSPKAHIYGPLSTTNELSVAHSFGDGLIVVLQADEYDHNKYFDMSFVSDFCAESEFFFIGGLLPMRFKNILNTKKGLNYEEYIQMAGVLFNRIMNGLKYKFKEAQTKAQIIHLIESKLNPIPAQNIAIAFDDYILKLFDRYCVQRTAIAINYPYFETQFKELFFAADMINLNAFFDLFVNLKHLRIDYIHLSHQLFEYIVDTLSACGANCHCKTIQFNYPVLPSPQIKIEQYITKYTHMFDDAQWNINYDYLSNKLYIQSQNKT
eukprot:15832_1